jgi:hypothetical protein
MPKCQHCGTGIDGAEINYRPSSKGGYRQQSMRLCQRCVDTHDASEAARKMLVMGGGIALVVVLIGVATYLALR